MKNIMDVLYYLEEFNEVSVSIRLILATIMGGIIGMERGATRHAAGLRTFILVCVGAALAQVVNIHLVLTYGTGDPVRLAQGVINGIGFLGVGTIVITGSSHIKGLTTAATLWTTAVLGISIGSGYIYSSVITFALIMMAIKLMAGFSRKQMLHNRILQVKIEVSGDSGIKNIVEYLHKHGYRITEIDKRRNDDKILLGMDIDLGKKINHDGVIEEIYGLDDVDFVMEIF